jgi:hypothetical protein
VLEKIDYSSDCSKLELPTMDEMFFLLKETLSGFACAELAIYFQNSG